MSESHSQLANRLRLLSVDELCAVILEANLNAAVPVMTRMVMGTVAAPIFAEALMSGDRAQSRTDVLARFREQNGGPVLPEGVGTLAGAVLKEAIPGRRYCQCCKFPAPDALCSQCSAELRETLEPIVRGANEAAYYCPDDVADDHTVLVSFTVAELRAARAFADRCLSRAGDEPATSPSAYPEKP